MSTQHPTAGIQNSAPSGLSPVASSSQSGLHRPTPKKTPQKIAASNHAPNAQGVPTPLRKRPKGRAFVTTVLLSLVGLVVYFIYTSYLSTVAYGSVKARLIQVSPLHEGVVGTVHVTEGEHVHAGQLLVTLKNTELLRRLSRAGDKLKLAQSEVGAELVRLDIERERIADVRRQRETDQFALLNSLQTERATLGGLQKEKQTSDYLIENDVATMAEHEAIIERLQWQQQKVASLEKQVEKMRKDQQENNTDAGSADMQATLLKPKQVEVGTLQEEIKRLRAEIEEGRICSPVTGRIVRVNRLPGEQANVGEPAVEVVEDGSIEIELFLTQSQIDDFKIGSNINLLVNSGTEVACEVRRLGMQFQNPPTNLVRFYPSQAKVVPVYLQPSSNQKDRIPLFLDSQVRLPRRWLLSGLFSNRDANPAAGEFQSRSDRQTKATSLEEIQ